MSINDDVRSPEALADPHAFFRRLREHDPVHWSAPSNAWLITGHEEVAAAFKDARLSSDRLTPLESRLPPSLRAAMAQTFELLRGWMVFRDPPVHEHLRDPVRRAFTRRSLSRLTETVQTLVDELLAPIVRAGRCELIRDLAFPLPAIVIAELLGVPAADRERFKTWSRKLAGLVFGAVEAPGRNEAASEAAAEFTAYFSALIRRYEADPQDNLISALIAARDQGDALTADQMVGACTMLLFGGHETTTTLIGNGVATLLAHPDQLARVRDDPALAPLAVEECLRFEGPASIMVRLVTEDHERGGHGLRAGERVYLGLAAANRDPAVFPEPDRFDVARDPNPHLAFGLGLHFCLGASLARLEAAVTFASLVRRFPVLRLDGPPPAWAASLIGRGVTTLHLSLGWK
jgi:cytochrome P450